LTPGAAWTELGPSSGRPAEWIPAELGSNRSRDFLTQADRSCCGLRRTAVVFGSTTCWPCRIFRFVVPNPSLTIFPGTTVNFNGTVTSINGYDNSVELSCTAGTSALPFHAFRALESSPDFCRCGVFRECGQQHNWRYNFNVQGSGTDPKNTTHLAALTLNVVDFQHDCAFARQRDRGPRRDFAGGEF